MRMAQQQLFHTLEDLCGFLVFGFVFLFFWGAPPYRENGFLVKTPQKKTAPTAGTTDTGDRGLQLQLLNPLRDKVEGMHPEDGRPWERNTSV